MQTSKDAAYLPRHAGLRIGVPVNVPSMLVNRLCGSGFQAVINAAQASLINYKYCKTLILNFLRTFFYILLKKKYEIKKIVICNFSKINFKWRARLGIYELILNDVKILSEAEKKAQKIWICWKFESIVKWISMYIFLINLWLEKKVVKYV